MDDETRGYFDRIETQLAGIVNRLDGIDDAIDGLSAKIDRQAVMATTAMQAAEQALTSLTAVSRRLKHLENTTE